MTASSPGSSGMPGPVIAAAVVGGLGVLPLALIAVLAFALGGVRADVGAGRDWAAYVLLLLPLVELLGVVRLIARRGRWALVLGAVASLGFAGLVIHMAASVGESVGGWPFILAVCPVLAAVLASRRPVRAWLAGRPRSAA